MKINQIADVLNGAFFPETTGTDDEHAIFKDDLSNVVELGTSITSSSNFGNMMNGYLKSIFDKVGETVYSDMGYESGGFDLHVTDAELGGVLEKIRIEAPDFDENLSWTFTDGDGSTHEEMFGYHPVTVDAKYFMSKTTFRTAPYTITEKQFRTAFTSIENVYEFIGRIEQRVIAKRNLAINILNHRAVTGLIAEKLKTGNNVINLLDLYITESGDTTVTADNWRTKENFLLYANTYVRTIYDLMHEPTGLYNDDGYISQTTDENSKFYLLSDFSRAIESYVYRSSYNVEDVRLTGYKTIAYWQAVGNDGTEANYTIRSSIYAVPASEGEAPVGEDTRQVVNESGIVGVIFNRYAAFINAKRIETGVQTNDFDKWANYIHMFEAGYYVDPAENCVVFIIKNPS